MLLPVFSPLVSYTQHVVDFDGTNDWLTRGAGLTGAADGKQYTFSGWVKSDVDGSVAVVLGGFTSLGGSTARVAVQKQADDSLLFVLRNSAGTDIVNASTAANTMEAVDGRLHIAISVDTADVNKRHIFINGVNASPTWTTYTIDGVADLTLLDWAIGATAGAAAKWNGPMADILQWQTYYDVATNIADFISGGNPVDPDVAVAAIFAATAVNPIIRLSGSPTSTWKTNDGSGGGFTENGTLTDGSF